MTSLSKTTWRGYIDAQNKTDQYSGKRMVTHKNAKFLQPLAKLIGSKVEDPPFGRGNFFVVLIDDIKVLPLKMNEDYLYGWFLAIGIIYDDPLKITLTSTRLKSFIRNMKELTGLKFTKPMRPHEHAETLRVTLTGPKAIALYEWSKKQAKGK